MPLVAIEHEVAAVILVTRRCRRAAASAAGRLGVRLAQLVFERSTSSTPARLSRARCEALDDADPLDVSLAVERCRRACAAGARPLFRRAQRLRMHADELGGDADHVDRRRSCVLLLRSARRSRAPPRQRRCDRDPAADAPERRDPVPHEEIEEDFPVRRPSRVQCARAMPPPASSCRAASCAAPPSPARRRGRLVQQSSCFAISSAPATARELLLLLVTRFGTWMRRARASPCRSVTRGARDP